MAFDIMTTYRDLYLFRQQIGKPCAYCHRKMNLTEPDLLPTEDHVHPRSKGGYLTVWACWVCNQVKRDMTLAQWKHYMAENPKWWEQFSKRREVSLSLSSPLTRDWPWLNELMAWSRHNALGCKEFFD
jgi:hypothetical protein